jgi:hypothetical protein
VSLRTSFRLECLEALVKCRGRIAQMPRLQD